MTDIVSFELAKLLKEKGFDKLTINYYSEEDYFYKDELLFPKGSVLRNEDWPYNVSTTQLNAPTIAEVVTWLYKKHGIHFFVLPQDKGVVDFRIEGSDYPSLPLFLLIIKYNKDLSFKEVLNTSDPKNMLHFDTFEEAYNYAIKYTLNNLI